MKRTTNQLVFQRRYNILDGREVAKRIEKIFEKQCPLTDYQKDWLRRELGDSGIYGNLDMPFQAYEWDRVTKEKTLLQRISTPFVLIICCMLFVTVCPIKWLFTNKFMVDCDNKYLGWLYKWSTWTLDEKY